MLDRVAGYPIEHGAAAAYLRRLGCTVREDQDGLRVQPPTWRHDLTLPDDLAEEVLRLNGYEAIPSVLPPLDCDPVALAPDYLKRRRLALRLANLGFFQTVTLGFVDPLEDKEGHSLGDRPELRTLKNPLGEDYSLMRGTLLRDLARVAQLNLERGAKEVRLFEIAPVFEAHAGQGPERDLDPGPGLGRRDGG